MIKLGWALTVYLGVSFVLFLITSNTMLGGIIYLFLLLPFYGIVLLGWWLVVWSNRSRTARIKYWIWSIVLVLQIAVILVSPGNCYGYKQGAPCYANLQILLGHVPRNGPSDVPHWEHMENAFPGLLMAYGVAVLAGLFRTSITSTENKSYPNSQS